VQLVEAEPGHPLSVLEGASVLHWHGDEYTLPEGARALARTPLCENQAFAWRKNGLALQFHPEVTVPSLERWFIGHVVELIAAGVDIHHLRRETLRHAPRLRRRAQSFFDAWLSQLSHGASCGPIVRRHSAARS